MPDEGEFEDFEPKKPTASSHKNREILPRPKLTPTSELEIIHTEDGPKIVINEYTGTKEDVRERIDAQTERISSLPTAQRTIVEQKYIDKKTSGKLDKAS